MLEGGEKGRLGNLLSNSGRSIGPGNAHCTGHNSLFCKHKYCFADANSDFTMFYIITDWRNMGFDFGR